MSPRTLNLLTVLLLLILLVGVCLTAPRWAPLFRQPLQAADEEPSADAETPPVSASGAPTTTPPALPTPEPSEVQRTINVKLFFEAANRPGLVAEDRTVPFSADLSRQIVSVLEE